MVKTLITPSQTNIHISIPQDYIGRELEILLYPIDEITDAPEERKAKKKASDFIGTLSKEEGEKFHAYLKETRNEWERDI